MHCYVGVVYVHCITRYPHYLCYFCYWCMFILFTKWYYCLFDSKIVMVYVQLYAHLSLLCVLHCSHPFKKYMHFSMLNKRYICTLNFYNFFVYYARLLSNSFSCEIQLSWSFFLSSFNLLTFSWYSSSCISEVNVQTSHTLCRTHIIFGTEVHI